MEVLPVRWGCCMKKWWVHRVDILHWFKGKQPSLVGSFKYALEAYDCDDDHSWHAYFPGAQPSSEICIPHSSHKKSEKRLKQLKLGLQWFTDETLDLIKSIGLKQIESHIETSIETFTPPASHSSEAAAAPAQERTPTEPKELPNAVGLKPWFFWAVFKRTWNLDVWISCW